MRKAVLLIILSIILLPLCMGNADVSANTERTPLEETSLLNLNDSIDESISDVSLDAELNFEQFGDQEDFWTLDMETNNKFTLRATLLAVGDFCYIYMDNRTISSMGQSQAIDKCEILSSEFDHTVYPKNVELMGNPDGTLGDIDGDPHITVFLVQGVGNYFLFENELIGYQQSNLREMVYVQSTRSISDTTLIMCHETNHLFLFNRDSDEAVFFMEGLAEFSTFYAGYLANSSFLHSGMTPNITMSAYQFSIYPFVSMFFFDWELYVDASYGLSYMFFLYLYEKYGIQVIKDLIPLDALDGPASIEYVLSSHGYNLSFNDLFLDLITALTIDEPLIYDDLFGFNYADFDFFAPSKYFIPFSAYDVVHRYYCVDIKQLMQVPNEFTIDVETPDSPRSLGLVVIIQDDTGWNVTQSILTGDGSTERFYFNGVDIEKVLVITTIVKEGTPNAPREFMTSPTDVLDFAFLEGHVIPVVSTTDETRIMLYLLSLPYLLALTYFLKKWKIKF